MTCTEEYMAGLLNQYQNDPECRFDLDYLSEKDPNPFQWKALLEGLQGSIYEGGFYMVKIIFPDNYPESRPSLYFLNKIFHPHVEKNSLSICIESCPEKGILPLLDVVENMFSDYDADLKHAFPQEPRQLLQSNQRDEFIKKAKEWVRNYAKASDIEQFYDL